eukprot:TRINITY_DN6278_c0_g1_i4.p1 TRINITY_DN6278_c0_g1~~TRINITY_DN6278_c0_g1_i4.p1  ORF type:complete len:435 (+),score=140.44 TRINITY_DN6278_c0_g1_i4:73-1377(+)
MINLKMNLWFFCLSLFIVLAHGDHKLSWRKAGSADDCRKPVSNKRDLLVNPGQLCQKADDQICFCASSDGGVKWSYTCGKCMFDFKPFDKNLMIQLTMSKIQKNQLDKHPEERPLRKGRWTRHIPGQQGGHRWNKKIAVKDRGARVWRSRPVADMKPSKELVKNKPIKKPPVEPAKNKPVKKSPMEPAKNKPVKKPPVELARDKPVEKKPSKALIKEKHSDVVATDKVNEAEVKQAEVKPPRKKKSSKKKRGSKKHKKRNKGEKDEKDKTLKDEKDTETPSNDKEKKSGKSSSIRFDRKRLEFDKDGKVRPARHRRPGKTGPKKNRRPGKDKSAHPMVKAIPNFKNLDDSTKNKVLEVTNKLLDAEKKMKELANNPEELKKHPEVIKEITSTQAEAIKVIEPLKNVLVDKPAIKKVVKIVKEPVGPPIMVAKSM